VREYREVMRLLVRVVLIAAIGLLAAGTQVAPHEHLAGWTHEGLDHPPSALHATLLEHVRYLLGQQQHHQSSVGVGGTVFDPAPVALAVDGSVVLALFAFRTPRLWRPDRLGIARLRDAATAPQFTLAPALAPPRVAFSS
jgi:hypothetical protein